MRIMRIEETRRGVKEGRGRGRGRSATGGLESADLGSWIPRMFYHGQHVVSDFKKT